MIKMRKMISSLVEELREELSFIEIRLNILLIREMTIKSNKDRNKIVQIIYNLILNTHRQLNGNKKIEIFLYNLEKVFFVEISAKGKGVKKESFNIIRESHYKFSEEINGRKVNIIYSINDNLTELKGELFIWSQMDKGIIFKLNFNSLFN